MDREWQSPGGALVNEAATVRSWMLPDGQYVSGTGSGIGGGGAAQPVMFIIT